MAAKGGRTSIVEDLARVETQVAVPALDDEIVEDSQYTLLDPDFDTASVLHTHNCTPVTHNEHVFREQQVDTHS